MNWFRQHLNWTVVLAALIALPVRALSEGIPDILLSFLVFLIGLAIVLGIIGWTLRQRNRSLFWLFMAIVPFGWIVFFTLSNHTKFLDIQDGHIVTIEQQ